MSSAPRKGAWLLRNAISPATVRATTMSASPEYRIRSGDTTSARSVMSLGLELLGLLPHGVGVAHVEERLLGQVVELAVDQGLEAGHRLVDRHEDALEAGEHLAHEE